MFDRPEHLTAITAIAAPVPGQTPLPPPAPVAPPPPVQAALKRRQRTLQSFQAYDNVINAIKSGDLSTAAECALRHPHIWPMLIRPITARPHLLVAMMTIAISYLFRGATRMIWGRDVQPMPRDR